MTSFVYDDTLLAQEEKETLISFILYDSDIHNFGEHLSNVESDNDTVSAYLKKAHVILKCLKGMSAYDRAEFLYKHCTLDDTEFLCKIIVRYINLEASMEKAEELMEAGISEGAYLKMMNTLKHMYAVKKRYWE